MIAVVIVAVGVAAAVRGLLLHMLLRSRMRHRRRVHDHGLWFLHAWLHRRRRHRRALHRVMLLTHRGSIIWGQHALARTRPLLWMTLGLLLRTMIRNAVGRHHVAAWLMRGHASRAGRLG